jgi:exodeoxyribonuclease-3
MPRVLEWIGYAKPDVLCLQETKMADAAFPALTFASLGYEAAHHGSGRWNGVAILSKVGLEDVSAGFEGAASGNARILSATCAGVRVSSLYVPNGRSLDSEQYREKLAWLDRLYEHVTTRHDPGELLALCGDFNIAPEDRDVWDPSQFVGATHVSEAEREVVRRLERWGLVDAFRCRYQEGGLFSWWDYRAGAFHKHQGMRIDLVLATRRLADRVSYALVDRFARKGKSPSDHAPLLVDFDLEGAYPGERASLSRPRMESP